MLIANLRSTDADRLAQRVADAEAKVVRQKEASGMLRNKVAQYQYLMQELQLTYNQTNGKVYFEEDCYLLCRLACYGLEADDMHAKIKKDISGFPVFTSAGSSRVGRRRRLEGGVRHC